MQRNPLPQIRTWIDAAYDPQDPGHRIAGAAADRRGAARDYDRPQYGGQSQAQNIASGFDFLSRTAGFDVSQSLVPYSRRAATRTLSGWDSQHPARRRARHRVRDRARVCARHWAAVRELARIAAGARLRRDRPQRAAAAAAPRLVRRRAARPARPRRRPSSGGACFDVRGLHVPLATCSTPAAGSLSLRRSLASSLTSGSNLGRRNARSARASAFARLGRPRLDSVCRSSRPADRARRFTSSIRRLAASITTAGFTSSRNSWRC